MMNRQARVPGTRTWVSFGNVTYIEAGRKLASILHATAEGPYTLNSTQRVEVRDEFDGLPPVTFVYRVDVVASCLNPRLGS
jgi:hypothetical protein